MSDATAVQAMQRHLSECEVARRALVERALKLEAALRALVDDINGGHYETCIEVHPDGDPARFIPKPLPPCSCPWPRARELLEELEVSP